MAAVAVFAASPRRLHQIWALSEENEDHRKAQNDTDKAEIAILEYTCRTVEELALKREWFNEKSYTCESIAGGDYADSFLQALVAGYFGKLDTSPVG